VEGYRESIGRVVDFGAGDGRFARFGQYASYHGYEIDETLVAPLPTNAHLVNACAFSTPINDADICIGNPPFVRNQDLPSGWRVKATELLRERTGVRLSGLANAWQYFFLLALITLKHDGLAALILPYEWLSRPSARHIRGYIQKNGWNVDVYRLVDETFDSVLTTTSITIVDKSARDSRWRYFEELANGDY
jgi:type I restriction-modification system DNA methylase subunit